MNRHLLFLLCCLCSSLPGYGFQAADTCHSTIHVTGSDAVLSNKGRLLIARTRGQAPFQYTWSDGSDTKQIRVSEPGIYCVIVEDATGCISEACVDLLSEKCKTQIKVRRSDSLSNTGNLQLVARSFGTKPYRYAWSSGDTTQVINVDSVALYCVVVTDSSGCVSRACIDLRRNCKLDVKIRRHPNPNSDKPGLLASTRGGHAVSYLWSTGDTTRFIVPDTSGRYCVQVTDRYGCISRDCIGYVVPGDTCSVQIKASPPGILWTRTRPYRAVSYAWSTGDTVPVIKVDSSGEYCVTVTDRNGCESSACIRYEKPFDRLCTVQIASRMTDHGLHLTARTKSNYKRFSYLWSTGDTTRTIVAEMTGIYTVTITSGECTATDTFDVVSINRASISGDAGTAQVPEVVSGLQAYPNPFSGDLSVDLSLTEADEVDIAVFRIDGVQVWNQKYHLSKGRQQINLNLYGIDSGLYLIRVVSAGTARTIKVMKE